MRGIEQTFAQFLLRRFRTAARIFQFLLFAHARQARAQFTAYLVRTPVEFGGNVHRVPAGGLQHAFDLLCLSGGAGDDQVHLFLAGEETDGGITGQAERVLETLEVGARQRADADIQQRALLLQQSEVDADVHELVERPEQLCRAAVFFAQPAHALLVFGAAVPHRLQPRSDLAQLLRCDRLHRRNDGLRRIDLIVGQYLVEVRAGFGIGPAPGFARQLGELFG